MYVFGSDHYLFIWQGREIHVSLQARNPCAHNLQLRGSRGRGQLARVGHHDGASCGGVVLFQGLSSLQSESPEMKYCAKLVPTQAVPQTQGSPTVMFQCVQDTLMGKVKERVIFKKFTTTLTIEIEEWVGKDNWQGGRRGKRPVLTS